MKQKRQKGFTLIELMIVVAIVAILAAVALPFYANFTFRAKMSEVAAAIDACKVSLQDYHEAEDTYPSLANSGCDTSSTQYVSTIALASVTQSTVAVQAVGTGDVAGCSLQLSTPDGGANWNGAYSGCDSEPGKVPPLFRLGTF